MSVRLRLLGTGVGMVTLAVVIVGYYMTVQQRETFEQELENKAGLVLAAMAVPCLNALASNRIEDLDLTVEEFQLSMGRTADVEWLSVLDTRNRIVGHTDETMYGRLAKDDFSLKASESPDGLVRVVHEDGGRAMLVSLPLVTRVKDLPGIRWGTILARLGMQRADAEMEATIRTNVRLLVLFAFITALLLFFMVERMILRPMAELTRAAHDLGQGDLSARTGLTGSSEVARLGSTFDRMASQLEQHTHHLEHLVDERTSELEASNTTLRRTAEQLTEANEKLEELARTDALTGLFNRRYLKETLQYYFALARRGGRPIALAMLDVDHFKLYNDTHGHPAGDEVLKGVAETMRERVRSTDIPCRYGGEEFAILFPDTDVREAYNVAEFLRQKLEDRPFPNEETQPGGALTVSIGVAGLDPDLRDPVELIQRADAALYRAKAQGRNCTVLNE